MMRRWHVVKNHGKTLSPAAEAFRYFLLEQAQSRLPPGAGDTATNPARGSR